MCAAGRVRRECVVRDEDRACACVVRLEQERSDYRKRDAERKRREHKRNARGGDDMSKEELAKMFPDPTRLEGLLIANQVPALGLDRGRGRGLGLRAEVQVES